MRNIKIGPPCILIILFVVSCGKEKLYHDVHALSGEGVIEINEGNVRGNIGEIFSKYIYLTASNQKRIDIFGTEGVSDEQMEYVRDIFNNYFNTEGQLYSRSAKQIIANSMANKKSALVFFDTEEQYEDNILQVSLLGYNVQDLYASESLNSGERDASYEEILHLVHNYGISPTLYQYQSQLSEAANNAVSRGLYTPPEDVGSADYDDEYFAAIMECFLGFWEGTDGTFDGEYTPSSKQDMINQDPDGYALIRDLFGDIQPVQ